MNDSCLSCGAFRVPSGQPVSPINSRDLMTQRLHPASVAALLAALAASPAAFADEVLVPVPGAGWHLRMDLPSAVKPGPTPPGGLYGAGAGRFNVTAFAEERAWCPGPETNENVYKCFAARLRTNPIVDWDTERGNTMPNGVQVMYMKSAWACSVASYSGLTMKESKSKNTLLPSRSAICWRSLAASAWASSVWAGIGAGAGTWATGAGAGVGAGAGGALGAVLQAARNDRVRVMLRGEMRTGILVAGLEGARCRFRGSVEWRRNSGRAGLGGA